MSEKPEIKKKTIFLCGTCKKELSPVGAGFDLSMMFSPVAQRYCPNNKCSRYGVVVVVAIPKEITL